LGPEGSRAGPSQTAILRTASCLGPGFSSVTTVLRNEGEAWLAEMSASR
jgi:hypothetical protein